MAQQFEVLVVEQGRDVATASGEEIVDAENLVPPFEEFGTKMRADETGPARHKDALHSIPARVRSIQAVNASASFW